MNPHPSSIRIFLAEGLPDGTWLVEKSNWTGLAFACPRSRYGELRKRAELSGSGVYVLLGPPDNAAMTAKLYIGETDDLKARLDNHFKNKEFWTRVVVFTSKDANLNKAHVRYLESRLIGLAAAAGRAELANGTAQSAPPLSEADRADAEAFLAEMLVIYRVLGVLAFEAPDSTGPEPDAAEVLHLIGKGAKAHGRATADGFLVLAGSIARPDEVTSIHAYGTTLRTALLASGTLVPTPDGLRMTRDYEFSSPSTAAMVMLGRTSNGRKEWKTSSGVTLRALQERALEE